MIRMIQSRAAGQAKAYFSDALLKSDYYVEDQELAGLWQGRLAGRLGLSGIVGRADFFALCENRHPQTGEHLTPRTKADRTTGYDINFHCPKSVSLLHVLGQDDRILEAFQQSVSETMLLIEADSQTRVRKSGQQENRPTGELAWAQFVHQTARPVEGQVPDPHLHVHCFVFNATWDAVEGKTKAGQFRDIKRDMPYYQAHFQKTLSDKMMTLGYDIRTTPKSFEVDNVPSELVAHFSKRTDEIGRIAKEKGITDAKELGELGARTRAKKQKGVSMDALKDNWREQAAVIAPDFVRSFKPPPARTKKEQKNELAQACVDYAVLHCFERASVMPERRLMEAAWRFALGKSGVTSKDIETALAKDPRIIRATENGGVMCTTQEVLEEEKRMVELAKAGKGRMIPLYKNAPPLNVSGQQAAAVEHLLTTANRVSIIRGAAGTGKTTLMKEAVEKIQAAGKIVMVVAPTAQASRGVLKDEGFAAADTVAKLLVDAKMQEALRNQVLWVDEAGLLGTQDMKALLEIATRQNARVVLGGDTRQHASVVRGDALRILNTVAGIQTAEVSKIYRQRDAGYRAAVEDLSKGEVADAFAKLDGMGAIKTIDPMKPNIELVRDYVDALKRGKTALVIAPTHSQGKAVTQEIRQQLRAKGLIGKKEIMAVQYVSHNYTEAEKQDTRNYRIGEVVQLNQNRPGFVRGDLWTIAGLAGENVLVSSDSGEKRKLPLSYAVSFDVMVKDEIALSKGDKIRITRNSFDKDKKRLNNGQMLEVTGVSKTGAIKLRNAAGGIYELDARFGHLAHAHCITSYASQGKTVDEVFISQPAATFPATDAKQFYVSVSRGRDKVRIYTDDKDALLRSAKEMRDRQSAISIDDRLNMDIKPKPLVEAARKSFGMDR